MKSALVLVPHEGWAGSLNTYRKAFTELLIESQNFSDSVGRKTEILLQHSLKEDRFAVQIEAPPRTGNPGTPYCFYGVGKKFEEALTQVIKRMREVRKEVERRVQNAKPKARREGRRRTRRTGSEG